MRPRGRPARGRRDRARVGGGPRAEERPGALRARAGGRPRRRGDAAGGARGAAAGRPHGHAPVPVRTFVEGFRGWGRSLRRAVGRWYAAQAADALAYQAVKYRQRDGRDAPRPAAPRPPGASRRRRQPDARRLGRARSAVRVDRPRRRRRTDCRAWSRASCARRRRRRRGGRGARPRVPPAARGGPAGAPDLAARSGRRCSRTCR